MHEVFDPNENTHSVRCSIRFIPSIGGAELDCENFRSPSKLSLLSSEMRALLSSSRKWRSMQTAMRWDSVIVVAGCLTVSAVERTSFNQMISASSGKEEFRKLSVR